jgi:cytochrome c2
MFLLVVGALLSLLRLRRGETTVESAPPPSQSVSVSKKVSYVFGNYHDLEIESHRLYLQRNGALGGGIEQIDEDRLLVVQGDGSSRIFYLDERAERSAPFALTSPLDAEPYLSRHPDPQVLWYRVNDTLLEPGESSTRSLFFSYSHWDPESDCYAMRIAEAVVDFNAPEAAEWVVRYETEPCLELPFLNNGTGGRMTLLEDSSLLLSVGDHGWITPEQMQDPERAYGKMLRFDRSDWSFETFTTGHRNSQGLFVSDGEVWSTEHGPHGGDELNLLIPGEDYGWPTDSYGTDYGKKTLEHATKTGDHSRGRRPIFSWSPSIAISNLVRLGGEQFPAWEGDFMIGSLVGRGNGHALFRVRVREGRVVAVEKFQLRQAVRDLIELPDGRLALWNGAGSVGLVSSASHLFSSCSACHALRFESHGVGPDLMGVVGRPVASHEAFGYSGAMRKFGGVWTPDRLDDFLRDPARTVPGTLMVFEGIADAGTRAAIIEYLTQIELPE